MLVRVIATVANCTPTSQQAGEFKYSKTQLKAKSVSLGIKQQCRLDVSCTQAEDKPSIQLPGQLAPKDWENSGLNTGIQHSKVQDFKKS